MLPIERVKRGGWGVLTQDESLAHQSIECLGDRRHRPAPRKPSDSAACERLCGFRKDDQHVPLHGGGYGAVSAGHVHDVYYTSHVSRLKYACLANKTSSPTTERASSDPLRRVDVPVLLVCTCSASRVNPTAGLAGTPQPPAENCTLVHVRALRRSASGVPLGHRSILPVDRPAG